MINDNTELTGHFIQQGGKKIIDLVILSKQTNFLMLYIWIQKFIGGILISITQKLYHYVTFYAEIISDRVKNIGFRFKADR